MSEHPKGYCPVFGNYPREYNRAVHGPYYPWVNYNVNRDTNFSQVKLGEFKSWLSRRNFTPQAMVAAHSRMYHLWQRKWLGSRYGSPMKGVFQILVAYSFCSMIAMQRKLRSERNHKYHW